MLMGIPRILSPDLLRILMEMGHGDEIVLADGNFPSASHAQRLIRCDGHDVAHILNGILSLFPIDTGDSTPIRLMAVGSGVEEEPPVWSEYRSILQKHGISVKVDTVDRFSFYEQAKQAYAIVATGETALYGNIILKKGVVLETK